MRPFPVGSRPVPLAHLRRHPLIAAAAMIITAAAVSLITGCAAADAVAPPESNSRFQATVSGAIEAPLAGSAVVLALTSSTPGAGDGSPSRILGMADRASRTVVAFRWRDVATLPPGSYAVGTDSSLVTMMYDTGAGTPGSIFGGVSGTVTITTATDQLVGGSYAVTARASDTGDQIAVAGTFTAPVQAAPPG